MRAEDVMGVIDHAAMMGDRWLFLAVLVLLLLAMAAAIHFLVRCLRGLVRDNREVREAQQEALQRIITTQNDTALKLAVCIDHNTSALNECAFELRRVNERRKS
jgi:uncharacterized membrane protein